VIIYRRKNRCLTFKKEKMIFKDKGTPILPGDMIIIDKDTQNLTIERNGVPLSFNEFDFEIKTEGINDPTIIKTRGLLHLFLKVILSVTNMKAKKLEDDTPNQEKWTLN